MQHIAGRTPLLDMKEKNRSYSMKVNLHKRFESRNRKSESKSKKKNYQEIVSFSIEWHLLFFLNPEITGLLT